MDIYVDTVFWMFTEREKKKNLDYAQLSAVFGRVKLSLLFTFNTYFSI